MQGRYIFIFIVLVLIVALSVVAYFYTFLQVANANSEILKAHKARQEALILRLQGRE